MKNSKAYVLKSSQGKGLTNYFTCQSDSEKFVIGIPHIEVLYCTEDIPRYVENQGRVSKLCKKARNQKISEETLTAKLKKIMGDNQ